MSYSLGTILEIDLRTGRPVPPPPPPPPPTPMSDRAALVFGLAGLGLIGLLIWKAPKGAWKPRRTYRKKKRWKREPTVRIRMNRRRRRTSRRR
jgi:hypothetical protein